MLPKLDTRLWNLGVGAVIALSACKDPPTPTDDGPCIDSYGYLCDSDYDYDDYYNYDDDYCGTSCDYDDYDYDDDYCNTGCDYDDYYDYYDDCDYNPNACEIACHADEDCDEGSACLEAGTVGARCEPIVALEACPNRVSLLPMPFDATEAAVSVAFADLDADDVQELVVARADRVDVFDGTELVQAIPFEGATSVAAGNFSGPVTLDLAVASGNDVTVLAQDQSGTFAASATVTVPTGNVVELFPLAVDPLLPSSLVAHTDAFQVAILAGDDLSEAPVELDGVIASHVAVGEFDAGVGDDILLEDGGVVSVYGDDGPEALPVHATPAVHIATGAEALVRTFGRDAQTVLEAYTTDFAYPLQTVGVAAGRLTLADVDGDGNADAVITADDRASIAFGAPPGSDTRFECQATHYLGVTRDGAAAGDLDGDGHAEIAWGGDNGLIVFSPE